MFKILIRTSVLATTFLAFFTSAWAQSDEKVDVIISAEQPLSEALQSFADQVDLQVIFFSEVAEGKASAELNGEYEVTVALDTLLADTGLTYTFLDDDSVSVQAEPSSEPTEPGKSQPALSPALMAQNQMSAPQNQTTPTTSSGDEKEPKALEEIIVTGTHIRGVDNVGAASITFTREELDRAGFSTLEEVFESLPQNLAEVNVDGVSAVGVSDIASRNTELTAGISLRGLGPTSTLVLLNGKRRPRSSRGTVVDISAIPLSMVERVELITGGHSAIYGSDAVAGVVNIVTVTELDGAETQVYYGEASAGAERFNFSQTFGRNFGRGGFVLGYDYRKEEELDAADTGFVLQQSIAGAFPVPGLFHLRIPSEQHVGLFAGHYELSEKVELYADAHFSADKNEGGRVFDFLNLFEIGGTFVTDSDQYSVVGGVRFDVGKEWQLDVSGLHGSVDNAIGTNNFFGPSGTFTSLDAEPTSLTEDESVLTSFSAIADGPLGKLWGETISGAIGVDFRDDSYESKRTDLATGAVTPVADIDRDVLSIFGEIHLPLINRDEQRLEVSLAGRYDDYSDFGDTFNPQVGIEWEPLGGLTFRASFAQAFRAPELSILAGDIFGQVQIINDPLDPTGMTTATLFSATGGNPTLQAEDADTWTVGIDWEPSERSKFSLSYFNIDYEGRIDAPTQNEASALQDEALFVGLVTRNPTPEQLSLVLNAAFLSNNSGVPFDPAVDDPFAIFSNIVVFDNRSNNVGLEAVDGIDFQAATVLETGSGDWSFGLNSTYYLDFTRNITVASPPIDRINRPGRPVDLKLRGHIGWTRSAWNLNAYVNYVDSYDDTIAATPTTIDSWTTVDLTVRYDASEIGASGFLAGFKVTLQIDNALDEDPPFFGSNLFGLAYDGVNANPVGRFVSLQLSKRW